MSFWSKGKEGTVDNTDENRVPIKQDGKFENSPLRNLDNELISDIPFKIPPETLSIGEALLISAAGAFQVIRSKITGIQYLVPIYAFDETGSEKIFRAKFGAETKTIIQPIFSESVPLNGIVEATASVNEFINEITLRTNPGATLTNLRVKITSDVTGEPIYYYPNKLAWTDDTGIDLVGDVVTGEICIDLSGAPLALLSGQNLTHEYKIDSGILLGDILDNPYFGLVRQIGTIVNIVDVEDITDFGSGQVITSAERTKLNNITDNCTGNSWISGLEVTEASPKNQTVDYTAGTYLICGILKTIASGGNYDMKNAYGSVDHYSGMVTEQHRFVLMYIDVDEVMKSIAGAIVEKNEVPDWPILPTESVAIALVEIRVDKSNNPKDIDNKRIDDQRQPASFNTDEFVSVSAEDITTGHLIDKLSNNGNVQFSIENPGASEKVVANASNADTNIYYAEDSSDTSTNSTSYVERMSLTKVFLAGDYLIDVYYAWSQDSNSVNFMAEVTLDTVRIGEEHIQEISQKTGNQRNLVYRRFKVTLTADTHTIALNFATSSAAEYSYICDSSITVQKVNIL